MVIFFVCVGSCFLLHKRSHSIECPNPGHWSPLPHKAERPGTFPLLGCSYVSLILKPMFAAIVFLIAECRNKSCDGDYDCFSLRSFPLSYSQQFVAHSARDSGSYSFPFSRNRSARFLTCIYDRTRMCNTFTHWMSSASQTPELQILFPSSFAAKIGKIQYCWALFDVGTHFDVYLGAAVFHSYLPLLTCR